MPPPQRALIAGLGLIGGSIGLALRRRGWHVAFVDSDAALQPGEAADQRVRSIDDVRVDIVILATPVDVAAALLRDTTAPLVTSVCSVMAPLRAVRGGGFVAGHPLAGSQHRGLAAARADLFAGATWFVDEPHPIVLEVIAACGADVEVVDATEHDQGIALTSHLPQLLSTALAAYLHNQQIDLRFAGDGLRTFLRLAGSDASVWLPILEANRAHLLPHIDGVERLIEKIANGAGTESFAQANELLAALTALPSRR